MMVGLFIDAAFWGAGGVLITVGIRWLVKDNPWSVFFVGLGIMAIRLGTPL